MDYKINIDDMTKEEEELLLNMKDDIGVIKEVEIEVCSKGEENGDGERNGGAERNQNQEKGETERHVGEELETNEFWGKEDKGNFTIINSF